MTREEQNAAEANARLRDELNRKIEETKKNQYVYILIGFVLAASALLVGANL